jgi:cytochrome c-type biogenesis protein CcmH
VSRASGIGASGVGATPPRRRLAAAVALRRLLIAAIALAALVVPAAATAADCPRTTLAAVEADVMCPVCGTPLGLATEAPQAERQRALIQRLVDRCRSKEEIEQILVAQYGPGVLALPETEGFDLAAYVVPALAVLLAGGAVLLAARRWRRGGSSAAADGPDPDATEAGRAAAKRLDSDLERYDL